MQTAHEMTHDQRLLKHEDQIEELRTKVPEWIRRLERPATPALIPKFGPLVSTGFLRGNYMPYLRLTAAVLYSFVLALPVAGAETASSIPNFTGTWQHPVFPWFEPAASGPKPVTNLMRWPQLPITEGMAATKEGVSNYDELVGDYKNPILQPWAAEVVKKFGESRVRASPTLIRRTSASRCHCPSPSRISCW